MKVSDRAKTKIFSIAPGVTSRILANGENLMAVLVEIAGDGVIPIHSHFHEQIGICLKGKAEFQTDDGEKVLMEGMVYSLKGNEKHCVKPLDKDGAVFLNIFSPPREDYLEKIKD